MWKKYKKRQDLFLHKQKTNLKHIHLSDNRIIELSLTKTYFRCSHCFHQFFETFEFESPYGFHTKIFEEYVIASWGYMSDSIIAQVSKTSARKIYEILRHIDVGEINKAEIALLLRLDEIYLGVDEHAFSEHDMILIITELKTKKLIAVLDGITKEKLESWINSLPLSIQLKIKGYTTDMNKGYRNTLDSILSNPVHSVDKIHLFQEANRMVDDVRTLNSWLVKMNFVKADEIVSTGKIPKKLTKEHIREMNDVSMQGNTHKAESMKNKVENSRWG